MNTKRINKLIKNITSTKVSRCSKLSISIELKKYYGKRTSKKKEDGSQPDYLQKEFLNNLHAGLKKGAVLVGQGKKFELWDEAHWDESRGRWLQEESDSDNADLPDEVKSISL